MKKLRIRSIAALVLIGILGIAAAALAQTMVVIHVRTASGSPGNARVTLTPEGGGAPHACTTSGGTCRMPVPPGRYVVTAEPSGGGRSPIPRPVPIPPTSEVTVSVTLP